MTSIDRRKWLVVAAALCVFTFFLDKFIATPLFALWQSRSERIAELNGLVEEARSLAGRRSSLEARWREMTDSDLPSNQADAESLVLKSVSDWAVQSGIEVTALKPRWSYETQDAASLECQASASGSMKQVAQFLHELETGPLAVSVEEVTLNANDERGSRLRLDLRFSGVILQEAVEE